MKEIEIRCKLSEDDYNSVMNILEKNKIELKKSKQKDTYYCASEYVKNNNSKECPYIIRIRESDNGAKLTYKSFVDGGTSWIEEETGIDNIYSTNSILNYLNQKPYLEIEKNRISGKFENIEINLDNIKRLGTFIELEVMNDDIEYGKKLLRDFIKTKLLLNEIDIVDKGYVQLMEDYLDEHRNS